MVYRLTVAYDGSGFAGWQRQPNAVGVQQVLEEAVARVVDEPVTLVAAGRTDAGVHALRQVVHLRLAEPRPPEALVHGVNHHLPPTVRVHEAVRVRAGFHARKCALAKEYRYRTSRERVIPPAEAARTLRVPEVDLGAMREATESLLGSHDFSAFALSGGAHTQPVRRILAAGWHQEGPVLELRIVGRGFLRGMVRSLVGTLLEVGRGRRSPEEFARLLQGRRRGEAGPTAPAHALTLYRVYYDPHWLELDSGE